MIILMGWQFAAAEFVGAPVMVVILGMLFRAFLTSQMVDEARTQADKGVGGSMDGHAEMDMSVRGGPIIKRIFSLEGRTAISHAIFHCASVISNKSVCGTAPAIFSSASIPPKRSSVPWTMISDDRGPRKSTV